MYLFFDTETTGTPANYKAPVTDVDNWPRVIQLAFCMYDADRKLTNTFCELIKPNGWMVPYADFWTNNGFFQDVSMQKGIPIDLALDAFIVAANQSEYIIAHNMQFDSNILGCEMIRAKKSAAKKLKRLCTMEGSTEFCQMPNSNGYAKFKWPKLAELHEILFHKGFTGAHDALNDVKATAHCFFELVDRKIITLP